MSSMTLNLEFPLSDADRAVLSALATAGLGDLPPAPAVKPAQVVKAPAKAPKEEAPAEKPKAPAKATKEEAPAEKPKDGPTVEDAVARAAELLSEGKADSVKAALATLDISRVSQLKPSQVETFLKELSS